MNKALIVIDVQNEYFASANGKFAQWQADQVAQNIANTIHQESRQGTLIVAVQHIADNDKAGLFCDAHGIGFHRLVAPLLADKPLIIKHRTNAFLGTTLKAILDKHNISQIDLCGIMTQNCITHTALSPDAATYLVRVLADCCTAPTELIHLIALNALSDRVMVI